jgi:serine/threonine protein kinase
MTGKKGSNACACVSIFRRKQPRLIFADRYVVQDKDVQLGSGSYGRVFGGVDRISGVSLAIKVEKRRHAGALSLDREADVYEECATVAPEIIPRMFFNGGNGAYRAIVIELLGPSLEDVFDLVNTYATGGSRGFSLPTLLVVTIRLLSIFKLFHRTGYVHRDVKPANFIFSLSPEENFLHIIDFGLSTKYLDEKEVHVDMERQPGRPRLVGTPRFCSINAHKGVTLSRRDDLESLAYVFAYLGTGSLPWYDVDVQGGVQAGHEAIRRKKQATSPSKLCEGLPKEFADFVAYARGLKYDVQPEYSQWISVFKEVLTSHAGKEVAIHLERVKCDWLTRVASD